MTIIFAVCITSLVVFNTTSSEGTARDLKTAAASLVVGLILMEVGGFGFPAAWLEAVSG